MLCGIIEPAQLFSAFSGSTIVLIAAMMVVGSTLFHTGIAAKMADILVKLTGTSENGIMIAFMLVGDHYLRRMQRRGGRCHAAPHCDQRQPAGRDLRIPPADPHVLCRQFRL